MKLIKDNRLRYAYDQGGDSPPKTKLGQIKFIIYCGHDDTIVNHRCTSDRFWLVNLECKVLGFFLLFKEWRAVLSREPWTRDMFHGKAELF